MLHLLKWMEPFHPAVLQGWNAVLLPKKTNKKSMGIRCGCGEATFFFIYLLISIQMDLLAHQVVM